MTDVLKHIRCRRGDVAKYVLLPGSPERAKKIATYFDEQELVAQNREYILFNGSYKGVKVSVCSTGIGGPSASIAVEELIQVGAETLIRVGSAGARQPHIKIGEVVVVTGAYRGEGTSLEYIEAPYPAFAHHTIVNALLEAGERLKIKLHYGVSYTRDAYYMRDEDLSRRLTDFGVVCSEQECSTIFVVARLRGAKAGGLVGTDSNIWLDAQPTLAEKERLFQVAEDQEIQVALEACYLLDQKGE